MAGLLAGLGALGLKNLENMDLFEEKKDEKLAKDAGKKNGDTGDGLSF